MRCASLESWGNDCSTFPKPRPTPYGLDLYEGRALDSDPIGSVCVVSKGETLLILVNPLKTRGPSLLPEPRPGTSNNVRRTLALCHAGVNRLLARTTRCFVVATPPAADRKSIDRRSARAIALAGPGGRG